MNDTTVADAAAMIDFNTGIQNDVVTQGHAITHINLRINLHIPADGHAIADVGKCADIDVIGQSSPLTDMNGLFHTALLGALAVHEVQQVGQRLVGVLNADERGLDFMLRLKILADEYGRSLCGVDEMSIFGISKKR